MSRPKRRFGDRQVCAIGFGAMSFAGFFGAADDDVSMATLAAVVDAGIDHWDTANIYGMGRSEQIIGRYFSEVGDPGVHLATKASIIPGPPRRFSNDRDHLRSELDGSLKRLNRDKVDLFYAHRKEAERPVEELAETMAGLIDEGLIDGYGLSEVSPGTIKRAHAVHPVTAVQNEYSLWTRLPELGVIQTCAALGITFVPFSPVARGAFGRHNVNPAEWADGDFRKAIPRFIEPNWSLNRQTIDALRDLATAKGVTLPALALAWILSRNDTMVPIPGTRTAEHMRDWLPALDMTLTKNDLAQIDRIAPVGWAYGDRYSEAANIGPERYS